MSSEEWELFAIIRSGKDATFISPNTNRETSPNTFANLMFPQETITPFSIRSENYPSSFSGVVQPRTNGIQELRQALMKFISPTTTTTTTTITNIGGNTIDINPNSFFSNLTGISGQQQMQQGLHHLVPVLTTCNSIGASTPGFNIFNQHQQQPLLQHHQPQVPNTSYVGLPIHVPQMSPMAQQNIQHQVPQTNFVALSKTKTQSPKPGRLTQQIKRVRYLTTNSITIDAWAWQKYGQKAIKGSPYPRSYYKCCKKTCDAKKQVERSKLEPSKFIVTYVGDHDHEKPLHRNMLCGTTRVKALATHLPNTLQTEEPNNVGSMSLSGISPMLVSNVLENGDKMFNHGEPQGPDPEIEPNLVFDDDDHDILIPNLAAMSNIFEMGYQSFEGGGTHMGESYPNYAPGLI